MSTTEKVLCKNCGFPEGRHTHIGEFCPDGLSEDQKFEPQTTEKVGFTPQPWKFERQEMYAENAKLTGKGLGEHEGFSRDNDGSWIVIDSLGCRVATATFRGKAKRGQAWNAPDPEGQAYARLISQAPAMLEALEDSLYFLRHPKDGVCRAGDCGQCKVLNAVEAVIHSARGAK